VVLFEDKNDEEAITALGQRTHECQDVFAKFLTGLFHWKLDTSESRTYSLKPEDYPRLPLFKPDPAEKCVLLNQVFWLVLDRLLGRRLLVAEHVALVLQHREGEGRAIGGISVPLDCRI